MCTPIPTPLLPGGLHSQERPLILGLCVRGEGEACLPRVWQVRRHVDKLHEDCERCSLKWPWRSRGFSSVFSAGEDSPRRVMSPL